MVRDFQKVTILSQSIEKIKTIGKARRIDRDLGKLSRNRFSGSVDGKIIADSREKNRSIFSAMFLILKNDINNHLLIKFLFS